MPQGTIVEFEGRRPWIHPDAWIAPTATVIGHVTIGAGASVWYGAVVRGDVSPIRIGARANIQDNSVLHVGWPDGLTVGDEVTVGHNCVLHCSEVGDGSLIGNGAVLLDQAKVGPGSVVAAGSVVSPGTEVPSGVVVAGAPAKVVREVAGSSAELWLDHNAQFYVDLAAKHARSARLVTD